MRYYPPLSDAELSDLDHATARARGLLLDHYRALRRLGRLHGTITRAIRLRKQRDQWQAPIVRPTLAQRVRNHRCAVDLGEWQSVEARTEARRQHPQRRNWNKPIATTRDATAVQVCPVDEGRYSSRCTYTHWTYDVKVSSYARVCSGGLYYHYLGNRVYYPHPRGYRWQRDTLGVKLVSRANPLDDYHPNGAELMAATRKRVDVRIITRRLRENAITRRVNAKRLRQEMAAIERAEREGATVCLADSKRAGNCLVGTTAWCRKRGLDDTRHYPPSSLFDAANGDRRRVAAVVQVALRRHRLEMDRGYAILADHLP